MYKAWRDRVRDNRLDKSDLVHDLFEDSKALRSRIKELEPLLDENYRLKAEGQLRDQHVRRLEDDLRDRLTNAYRRGPDDTPNPAGGGQ